MAQIHAKQSLLRKATKNPTVKTAIELLPNLVQSDLQQPQTSHSLCSTKIRPNLMKKPLNNEQDISTHVSNLPTIAIDLMEMLNNAIKGITKQHKFGNQPMETSQPSQNKRKNIKQNRHDSENEIDPVLSDEDNTKAQPKETPAGFKPECKHSHCSAEVDAKKIWTKLAHRLCRCRKEKILAALQKHNETQRARSALLQAQITAHHAYASMMIEVMDRRNVHFVWLLCEDGPGQHSIRYQLQPKPRQGAKNMRIALIETFYEEIKKKSHVYLRT